MGAARSGGGSFDFQDHWGPTWADTRPATAGKGLPARPSRRPRGSSSLYWQPVASCWVTGLGAVHALPGSSSRACREPRAISSAMGDDARRTKSHVNQKNGMQHRSRQCRSFGHALRIRSHLGHPAWTSSLSAVADEMLENNSAKPPLSYLLVVVGLCRQLSGRKFLPWPPWSRCCRPCRNSRQELAERAPNGL